MLPEKQIEQHRKSAMRAAELLILLITGTYALSYLLLFHASESYKIELLRDLSKALPTGSGAFLIFQLPTIIYIKSKEMAALVLALSLALWYLTEYPKSRKYAIGMAFLSLGAYDLIRLLPWPKEALFYLLLPLFPVFCIKYACLRQGQEKSSLNPAVALLAILAIATFLRAWNITGYNGLRHTFVEGQVIYTAREILSGLVPYRDFVYTHPPLASYATAAAFKMLGSGLAQARILNALASALVAVPLYLVAKKAAGTKVALLSALLWALHPNAVESGRIVVRETLMVLFMLSSIAVVFYRKSNASFFAAGALLGLAVLSKEGAILAALPILFAYDLNRKNAAFFLSGLAISLLPLAYFYAVGKDTILFALNFHSTVLELTMQNKLTLFYDSVFSSSLFLLALSIIGAIRLAKKEDLHARFVVAMAIYTSVLLLHRTYVWHYGPQFLASMIILMAAGIGGILEHRRVGMRNGIYAFCALLLAAFALTNGLPAMLNEKNEDTKLVADELARTTSENYSVISPMLRVPFLANRKVPGELHEFGYQNRVLTSEDAIALLDKNDVRAVVMDNRITKEEFGDILKGLREHVQANYRKVSEISTENDNITIWVR